MKRLEQNKYPNLDGLIAVLTEALRPSEAAVVSVESTVCQILSDVRREGDAAVWRYNRLYGPKKETGNSTQPLKVEKEKIASALADLDPRLRSALERSAENIRRYHQRQLEQDWSMEASDGSKLGMLIRPIEKVALYIPGGTAAYPSTVLMNAIPAQLAGVQRLMVLSPPGPDGEVNNVVLAAAGLLGIEEVYRVGGAQAVAAAAYGTQSIPQVDKLVGPGNQYVAEAKRQVFGTIAIDMVAGPSEVMVVADASAHPELIAADLLAQAEHDVNARMALVTTDAALIEKVDKALELQMSALPRREILNKAMAENGWAILVEDLAAAFSVVNSVAPEHLEILTQDPSSCLSLVRHAGSIFVGPYGPEAVGDYYAGPNHTLPTGGTARFSSPLGVYDFIKRMSVTTYTAEALKTAASDILCLSQAEGLAAHGASIAVRMEKLENAELANEPSFKVFGETAQKKHDTIRLSSNENPWGLQSLMPDLWQETIFSGLQTNRYPDPTYDRLRTELGRYAEVSPVHVVCGNGSDELIGLMTGCFTTESGGGILTHGPTFGEYARAAAYRGCRYREIPSKDDLKMNLSGLMSAHQAEAAELIFICSPNNPTGEVAKAEAVLKLCDETRAVVVVDEAYYEFCGETMMGEVAQRTNLIVLRTLSKAFGMAGLRIGYAVAPKHLAEKLNRHRMPYNVNTIAEQMAVIALSNREQLLTRWDQLVAERERLQEAMSQFSGLKVYPSRSNFILMALEKKVQHTVISRLKEAQIEVRQYEEATGLQNCLRVTVGTPEQNGRFIQALKKGLKEGEIQ